MSNDRPTQLFMADTSVNEILDGMDIRGEFSILMVNGDSIAVQSPKGDFFHFLVQRPEGEFGAVVSCNVPPLFWTHMRLSFLLQHITLAGPILREIGLEYLQFLRLLFTGICCPYFKDRLTSLKIGSFGFIGHILAQTSALAWACRLNQGHIGINQRLSLAL